MAEQNSNNQSWWATLPGMITATATLLTAIGGLIAVLNTKGCFKENDVPPNPVDTLTQSPPGGLDTVPQPPILCIGNCQSENLPSITGFADDSCYSFKKQNNHIQCSFFKLGGGGSPWQDINANVISASSSPQAASVNSTISVVINQQNQVYFCQRQPGSSFSVWQKLNFATDATPSIAGTGTQFYCFAKNNDGKIFYNTLSEFGAPGDWKIVGENFKSSCGPSAASVGNKIFVTALGCDNRIYYNEATEGKNFNSQWACLDSAFKTSVAPSLLGIGNFIFFFAVINNQVQYNRSVVGQSFEGWKTIPGKQTNSPISAGKARNNYIFLYMEGTDGTIYLNQADLAAPNNSQSWVGWL